MSDPYILYGSYASYYTAKSRSYLRKKGIPFVERLPSHPLFRDKVRPTSGSHRIPQLLTPEQEVIQDTVAIQDHLEARFPKLPAFPPTPAQKTFVHLMELLASEGLVQLAWMHRWVFEGNLHFVKMEFGRSFKPQGNDQELMKYGNLIADRMMSYGLPESTQSLRDQLDGQFLALLELFEQHLTSHPYFLGGHPSAADYAIMGALHAHLGRDPVGLHFMQQNAPRVFRWVEHMIVPEVQSPEFYDAAIEYPPQDAIATTAMKILNFIADEFGQSFLLGVKAFNQAMQNLQPQSGYKLDPDKDQPLLAPEQVTLEGDVHEVKANLYHVWVGQRARGYYQGLDQHEQDRVAEVFGPGTALTLLQEPMQWSLRRVNNRLVVA